MTVAAIRRAVDALRIRVDTTLAGPLVDAIRGACPGDIVDALRTLEGIEPVSASRTYWRSELERLLPLHSPDRIRAAVRRCAALPPVGVIHPDPRELRLLSALADRAPQWGAA